MPVFHLVKGGGTDALTPVSIDSSIAGCKKLRQDTKSVTRRLSPKKRAVLHRSCERFFGHFRKFKKFPHKVSQPAYVKLLGGGGVTQKNEKCLKWPKMILVEFHHVGLAKSIWAKKFTHIDWWWLHKARVLSAEPDRALKNLPCFDRSLWEYQRTTAAQEMRKVVQVVITAFTSVWVVGVVGFNTGVSKQEKQVAKKWENNQMQNSVEQSGQDERSLTCSSFSCCNARTLQSQWWRRSSTESPRQLSHWKADENFSNVSNNREVNLAYHRKTVQLVFCASPDHPWQQHEQCSEYIPKSFSRFEQSEGRTIQLEVTSQGTMTES